MANYNGPEQYRPLSPWGYFFRSILYSIPVLGTIILLVHALGGTPNENVKNYARSYFCGLALVVIALIVIVAVGGGLGIFEKIFTAITQVF